MTVRREQHWLDIPHPSLSRRRRRTISNYIHFKEDDQAADWESTDPGADVATGEPDGWGGGFTFTYYHRKGALQCALGVDGSGRPHVRMRRANRRDVWVEYVWLGGGTPTMERVNRAIRFNGNWTNTRLVYRMGRHRIDSDLEFNAAGHPTQFNYGLKLAPGLSYQQEGNTILIKDSQGVDVMRLPTPVGKDSSTVAPTPDGTQQIAVTLTEEAPFNGNPVFRWTLDQDDLDTAVYPVRV